MPLNGGNMSGITTAGKWASLIRQWEESGITQKAFCQKRRISFWTFRSWRTKIRAHGKTSPSVDFVELPAALTHPLRQEAGCIRISCPGGVMIEVQANIEIDLLVAIIKAGRLP